MKNADSKKHLYGILGGSYSILVRVLPMIYRISRIPAQLFDAMIFVSSAAPIQIKPVIE